MQLNLGLNTDFWSVPLEHLGISAAVWWAPSNPQLIGYGEKKENLETDYCHHTFQSLTILMDLFLTTPVLEMSSFS